MHDPNLLVQPSEILELIAEVGQSLQVCDSVQVQAAQPEYGFPAQRELLCREVRGYVVPVAQGFVAPQLAGQLSLESGKLQIGGYVAYISAEDLKQADLKETTVLVYGGLTYQLKYLRAIEHRGEVLLHAIMLNQTQRQEEIDP